MTVPEVTEAINKAYAKTLHDPIINVDLKDFQKPFFVVTGQVAKPGQYDLRYDTTVSEAIAISGGLLPTAKTQVPDLPSRFFRLDGSEALQPQRLPERQERQ